MRGRRTEHDTADREGGEDGPVRSSVSPSASITRRPQPAQADDGEDRTDQSMPVPAGRRESRIRARP